MISAAKDLKKQQNGSQDVMVSIDNTWQKRGHSSHNGVVSLVNMVKGKSTKC